MIKVYKVISKYTYTLTFVESPYSLVIQPNSLFFYNDGYVAVDEFDDYKKIYFSLEHEHLMDVTIQYYRNKRIKKLLNV